MIKRTHPPEWAVRFFRWYCNDHLCEAVLGDMLEFYERRHSKMGKRKADWLFIWNVLQFIQPFALRKKSIGSSINLNYTAMFKNYLKVAWRSMARQKMYTSIKIGGFALGIALCLLIAMFVRDELSVDQHYENGDRIYRIIYKSSNPANSFKGTSFPAQTASVIKSNFPEIEKAGRLIAFDGWFDAGSNLFRPADQVMNVLEGRFVYADQEFIEMLEIPMVYGSRSSALSEPNSILISKRKADKYFPNQDPVGKTVILNDDESKAFVIGGVMENLRNSHIEGFDFFITLSGVEFWPGEQTSWCCWNYSPYIQVRPGTNAKELEQKLLAIRDDYIVRYMIEQGDQRADNVVKYHSLELQPVSDIHLRSQEISDFLTVGDIRIVWLFSAIGVFILLLACINFINLSTAKSANRAKEIGLRKVIGSYRSNLIRQFLVESVFFCGISVLLGTLLAWLAMPYFNLVAGKEMVFPISEWWLAPVLILFTFVVGLISGLYPSLYLSAFKPIAVLRGSAGKGSRSSVLRSSLVIFQFTTSIVLIVGAFIVHRQMQYILNKELGFEKEQVIMIQGTNTLDKQLLSFKNEILRLPEVEYATVSDYLPIEGTRRNGNSFWKEGRNKIDQGIGGQFWTVDPDYIDAMGMKLVEGRVFSNEIASDSAAIIINQTMAKKMGLENPVGERITNFANWTVVGVVEDFHFESMKGEIKPLAMVRDGNGSILSVKVNTEDMKATLASITNIWNEFKPSQPFQFTFLDESYARMYDDVQRTGNLFSAFAIFAIVVASLGLFGLSAFMVEQRGKEISIRKVLGASLGSIFNLITRDFLKLVFIALVVAIPAGWYMMSKWLEDYEYRIQVTWDVFAIAGAIAMLIALLTISSESIKAAFINPARKLRSE